MKLISCDNCAVILDGDNIRWPSAYDNDGNPCPLHSEWCSSIGEFIAFVECPVCRDRLSKGEPDD